MPLLQVSDLHVRLPSPTGPADAVRGVSFALERGQTLGLVGESGCGKSLMAQALVGLLPEGAVVSGSVQLSGEELCGASEAQLGRIRGRRVGMIFQEPMTALNPLHTVGDQVAEPLRLHKGWTRAAARAEAQRLLGQVGIPDPAQRMHSYPHQLSGGQRQRVTIAMALACGPDLLIADEPTTALDVTVAAQILRLIRDLVRERGMGLILISHDLGVIAQNTERVLVMYGGTVVESGPTAEVLGSATHPYTQGLLASRPALFSAHPHTHSHTTGPRPRLHAIPGSVPELHLLPRGCPFADRCAQARDACATQTPSLVSLGPHHNARCVLLKDAP